MIPNRFVAPYFMSLLSFFVWLGLLNPIHWIQQSRGRANLKNCAAVLCIFYFLLSCLTGQAAAETKISNEKADPYKIYDDKFIIWLKDFKNILTNCSSFQIEIIIKKDIDEPYQEIVVYSTNNSKEIMFMKNIIGDSKRLRWFMKNNAETPSYLIRMPTGKINFYSSGSRYTIHINIDSFMERTSEVFMEFKNEQLKNWIDAKMKKWAKKNSHIKAYYESTGKVLNIMEWYYFNTKYHGIDWRLKGNSD